VKQPFLYPKKNMANQNALKALIHENSKAIEEVISIIATLGNDDLKIVRDAVTSDPDCVSIKSVIDHMLRSGYNYIKYILDFKKIKLDDYLSEFHCDTPTKCIIALKIMDYYYEVNLLKLSDDMLGENDPAKKIKTKWGNYYDIDQLLEHAVMHVLRHRYQIEKFLVK
jgi:hypothetical protein